MKRTLAKLLLDVAKYVATVVFVSTFFSKFATAPAYVLYAVALLFIVLLVRVGVRLNDLADEEEKRGNKKRKTKKVKSKKRKE